MDTAQLNGLANFIWNIADDVLRDVYVRGKYRDVILPMTVLRRLDAVLEPTKQTVMEMKAALDKEGVANQDDALRAASGEAFYNTSPFLLRDLKSRATQQKLRDDFEAYLDGFSPNVQDILNNFEFRNQIPRLSKADALGQLIEKFLDKDINLSPRPIDNLPALDNHSMGTMFEELVRRFNEENNEEAGEHWTPRDVVRLMANLMFLPVADHIESGTYLLYDCACGTGGMLTVAEETLQQIAKAHGKQVATHLYGQEINGETYAICKADLLLKGDGDAADNIIGGPEHSTLSNDAFRSRAFDFMLANPPYGKSWKSDLERMGGKKSIKDPRFVIQHAGVSDYSLLPRSNDGQMLFLVNMLSKMKHDTPLGSRIAEVHNGSSLFTGDAGQGESNIRRWIIENDWLEAIVALPLNMFYNTGISTYVWVLTNRKPEHRRGQVQLIDATQWFRPLRKNMGKKDCELAPEDIQRICDTFLNFKETPQSKIFPNAAFGYWKVKVERPLRLHSQLTHPRIEALRLASGDEDIRAALYERLGDELFEKPEAAREKLAKLVDSWENEETDDDEDSGDGTKKGLPEKTKRKLLDLDTWRRDAALVGMASQLREVLGDELFTDHNVFLKQVDVALRTLNLKPSAADLKLIVAAVSWREESAAPVIKRVHKAGKIKPDPLRGFYPNPAGDPDFVLEYEPDSELRDFEQVPLQEEGGIEAFIRREVLPYTPDAWVVEADTKIGYEVSFTRHFYQPPQLRTLAEISADILKLEQETEGLLTEIMKGAAE
ncbi:N-6 DNA methylase [Bradyrhizobium sacchari]|uniref:site-specific DNA-methyltransferase (adenine-specific) n=1 Tax=Bradyrhizobium sacchari TaxID=1399419 RepID=A0A560JCG6_9BRAD|nr:class I SAM-dependent DNA methyltransferase [Bradyrhizobium sacchari]OPY93561.1 N-6 DNA methylase [Bradyrhizobium sacchari]TWB50904.1 type I restriction enzyme M protein [Bradyrhizobium sacchari]TWB68888.1 type I restriction enzyme M protein [Bradyrhizobium sacchari]